MSGSFPQNGGATLTYIPNKMGPMAYFWIETFGTCVNLRIYARQADIPKAL